MDKNPQIRTVINKIDNVGTESEYRTFEYEVLAGPDDLDVEVMEGGCVFRFNYAKVYWNSKLETEHRRIINLFKPGEVVCDVMAGIGPFAVPAGKNGVFVWANDKNPESHFYLKKAIEANKVMRRGSTSIQRSEVTCHLLRHVPGFAIRPALQRRWPNVHQGRRGCRPRGLAQW